MENLGAILQAAGSGLDRVVKTTVFLTDMADFAAMNEVYAKAFGSHRPAPLDCRRQRPAQRREGGDRSHCDDDSKK